MENKLIPEIYLGKEWNDLIGEEFSKEYMKVLGEKIRNDRKRFVVYPETPAGVFNVFRNVKPSSIKVIIVGQDPYPDGSYDGRAFSNTNENGKVSPSLKNILKEVEDDVYDGFKLYQNPNLSRWERQGVFLINRVLTVRHGNPNSHANIGWEIFTNKVIEKISYEMDNIVFMLWGGNARSVKKYIEKGKHMILESGHPSPLFANKGHWFGNKHFTQANYYLEARGKDKIIW